MSYAQWQNDRRNLKIQECYNHAVSAKVSEKIPIGTWRYQLPSQSKFGASTELWLTLSGDGSFDRLRRELQGLHFVFWKYDCGTWENLTNMSVRLTISGQSNRTEVVDLMMKTNLFVTFDQEVKEGIQPTPVRYRR